jgi:ABC-type uncharacterized transport system substrate-binding protein
LDNPVVPPQWNELQTAARKLGLTPQLLDIRKVEDIAPAFADATSQHVDALIVSVEALTQNNRSLIAQLPAGHGLPAIYVSKEYIDAGGLIAYGPSYPDLYRRAAIYVDKILRGANSCVRLSRVSAVWRSWPMSAIAPPHWKWWKLRRPPAGYRSGIDLMHDVKIGN